MRALPSVVHTRLHCADRNAEDVRDFLDRLSMVVDKIKNFAVNRRKLSEAFQNGRTLVLVFYSDVRARKLGPGL